MWNKKLRLFSLLLAALLLIACQSGPSTIENKTDAAPVAEQQTNPADDLYQAALQSAKSGDTDTSILLFQQLIEKEPAYPRAFTNLGLLWLQQDKNELAKKAFFTAIDQDKRDAIAYNHLAILERRAGSFKQARKYYETALDYAPDYANAHLNLGILLDLYLQDLPAAIKHYKNYQELTGNNDKTVEKWLLDIERRLASKKTKG